MHDPRSGLWYVMVNEWAARALAFIHAEAYDQHRFWYIPFRLWAATGRFEMRISFGARQMLTYFMMF